MKHIYPAYQLDELNKLYNEKKRILNNLAKEIRNEKPYEVEPELENEQYIALLTELEDVSLQFDEEHYRVVREYNDLFQNHYITLEEVETIFDLDRLYIYRHIIPNVSTMYLNRFVRKYIKLSHEYGADCILDNVLRNYNIDYEKKVFIHKGDLERWLFEHCESDDILITEHLVKYMLQNRKNAVMHSTETFKKMCGLKYGMQLQRMCLERIYMKATEGKPISRIPSGRVMDFITSLHQWE